MNIANKLTILRIILSFICMALSMGGSLSMLIAALTVFVIASVTDFFDGYYARKYDLISDLGKILDPIADKVLIIGVFLVFLYKGVISPWAVIIIMGREFLITALRMFALKNNTVIAAKSWGKHKTVSQITAVIVIYLLMIIEKLALPWPWYETVMHRTIFVLMVWVALITSVSGAVYVWQNRKLIRSS
jgi:CDP-diacylglycerol--glycerol-3-phosphate 3-phosphatidyltransferase